MPDEEKQAGQGDQPKKSRLPKTLILVLAIALVEGAGFYTATKIFGGGPQVAHGAEEADGHVLVGEQATEAAITAEIDVLRKFKVPNDKQGRMYIYDFDVVLKVPGSREEDANKLVEERKGEISDHIARIVRGADPGVLHEPELKALRMQLQHAVGEVVGDQDIIVEVLIPRCVPVRAD